MYVLDLESASDFTRCTCDGTCTKILTSTAAAATRVATGGGEVFFTDYATGPPLSRATSAISDLVTDPVPGVKSSPSRERRRDLREREGVPGRARGANEAPPQAAEIVLNAKAELIALDDEHVYWTDTDGYLSMCRMEARAARRPRRGVPNRRRSRSTVGRVVLDLDDDALRRVSP